MTDEPKAPRRGLFRFLLFSPKGFLVVAATLAALFVLAHAAGLRRHTSIVCGQAPTGDHADSLALWYGAAYVFLYLAFMVVVPVLLLAAAVFALLARLLARAPKAPPPAPTPAEEPPRQGKPSEPREPPQPPPGVTWSEL